MKQRKHIVITGTGRAGTTFLVELLTKLGLETGFDSEQLKRYKDQLGRGGLENDIRREDCPYIVKNPSFCDYAGEVIARDDIVIEHIFLPIRDLFAAAESRRFVAYNKIQEASFWDKIKFVFGKRKSSPGALWGTNTLKGNKQERILLNKLYQLMLAVSDSSVNITLINYPRSTKDAAYLFAKLKPVFQELEFQEFVKVFNNTVQAELVHHFKSGLKTF
ncbi:hypothetical protein [Lewinella sp. LCG006]|uniref:hypothetical protein n=1 Tax=Lewinella sp. LCG006 TaxID=3231911 RepID=UPI0034615E67